MNRKNEIIYALDDVIQSLIRLRNAVLENENTTQIPEPKFKIGDIAYAKTIGENVIIEDMYYDDIWRYKFHAPSSVSDCDYYSAYGEDGLEIAHKEK